MLFERRPKLSYANVTATLAVFLSLGGVSYAAVEIPRNSVGTPQLRDGAVDSAKIKDGALQYEDFGFGETPAGLEGPRGPKGVRGARGPKGAKGATGAAGAAGAPGATDVRVRTATSAITAQNIPATAVAQCQTGERAVGGGVTVSNGLNIVRVVSSAPTAGAGEVPVDWAATAEIDAPLTGEYAFVKATAVCAKP
jgi:hypothetical protein